MIIKRINSECDGLGLELAIAEPHGEIKAIVQFSHGMSEHKERYFDFMNFLSGHGYLCVIHDHRGHGKSVKSAEDLGYFYTDDYKFIVRDMQQVTRYIKDRYREVPLYVFSHSMGTLVARIYLKEYDSEVSKAVLCGPPTENVMSAPGLHLSRLFARLHGEKTRSGILNSLADGAFNKGQDIKNAWINSDIGEVEKYNDDELCGFMFTVNGYINLFELMKNSYETDDWQDVNGELEILLIAGGDDPVIQSREKMEHLKKFLEKLGYKRVMMKLYEGMRHEILNETAKNLVYDDVLNFFEK